MTSPGMRATGVLLGALAMAHAAPTAAAPPRIDVATVRGVAVPLLPERVQGIRTRPLAKLKETLDRRFGAGFLSLLRIGVQDGAELVGRCPVTEGPVRLTVYEVSRRREDKDRQLRVVATQFFAGPGDTAEFRTKVEALEEELFFVTAEQVQSAEELDSHLTYMNTQDNAITVKGFSSNWNLTALKVNLAGKDEARREVPFTKDAEWLVDHLIRPLWVVSIRIDPKS